MKKNNKDYGTENNLNLKMVIALSRTISSGFRNTKKFLSRYNLSTAQFGVLESLYHLGDMCVNELIKKQLSTSGNMTVVIRNLEKNALIKKNQSKNDKRISIISITTKGRKLIEEVFPAHLKDLNSQFSNLNDSDKSELIRLLKKLNGIDQG